MSLLITNKIKYRANIDTDNRAQAGEEGLGQAGDGAVGEGTTDVHQGDG